MMYGSKEWWEKAIERNRSALLRIVYHLWAKTGLDEGGVDSLPDAAFRAILAILRPAESAARRLLAVMVRDLVIRLRERAAARAVHRRSKTKATSTPDTAPATSRAADAAFPAAITVSIAPNPNAPTAKSSKRIVQMPLTPAGKTSRPSFPLFDAPIGFDLDPPRPSGKWVPRIRSLWEPYVPDPEPQPIGGFFPDGETGAKTICRRIVALRAVLEDLPGHALKFARKRARRDGTEARLLATSDPWDEAQRQALNKFCFTPAIRVGRPPGRRRRGKRAIDEILSECHQLALSVRPGFRYRPGGR